MNPWLALLDLLGWLLLGLMYLGGAIIIFGCLVWFKQELVRAKAKRKAARQARQNNLQRYIKESDDIAQNMFIDHVFNEEMTRAFRAGARWGWGRIYGDPHRRK